MSARERPSARSGGAPCGGVALRASDLTIGFGRASSGRRVLAGLDLTVHAGELVCLLGPNGIGKSTLLRTLAGMQPAMSGRIELGGDDLRRLTPLEIARRLGVVLTDRTPIGSLTARRIVEFGRYPHTGWFGTLAGRDLDVVTWALEAVGASHLAARDHQRLSDGERQRVMIARALAQEPLLLLLDEPTAFLDLPSRVELMGLLRDLARDEQLAVVISTHDLELALRVADCLWLVTPDGRVTTGAPEDIVLAGDIAAAFETSRIRFQQDERAFHLVNGTRGRACVEGQGLHAALARAVLEREGYTSADGNTAADTVTDAGPGTADLHVVIDQHAPRWQARRDDCLQAGDSFAALAAFLRGAGQ